MKDQNNNNAKAAHTLDAAWSSKYGGFKKKGGKNNTLNSKANNFKGLGFHIGKDGSKIYEKTIDKLALYTLHSSRMVVTSSYAYGQKKMWRLSYL